MKYFLVLFLYTIIRTVSANTLEHTPEKTIDIIQATAHSLIAPEGTRYQWYLNNIKINDGITQELAVTSAGFYRVILTTPDGKIAEKETIVGLTAAGAIIRIFTIGDSTVQDYTAGYYPRKGWGQVLPFFFNTATVSVMNKAVGGTSSKSFYNSFWAPVRDGLQPGDFVFIQFGINDRNNADTARYAPTGGVFEGYLTKFINETRAKGAFPVLVATLRRNAWNADGVTVYDAYHDHPVATRTVAKNLSVPLIDLDAKAKVLLESVGQTYSTRLLYNNYLAGEYPNYPAGNADDVHFQEMGAIEMAKLVIQGVSELSTDVNVSKLIPFINPQYQMAVSVTPAGADSVTTHTTTYPKGLTITLKTIPKTKSAFQKWNDISNTQIATTVMKTVTSGTAATSYAAIYAGASICTATITSPATSFCAGSSVTLTAGAGSSYKWFNGSTQVGTASTYTATAAGSYTVQITNTAGCSAISAAKTITVNVLPVITQHVKIDTMAWAAVSGITACETSTVNLGPWPTQAAGWVWTGPDNFTSSLRDPILKSITAADAGTYTAIYTDANGCKSTSTFILLISKPTATITAPNTSFCAGGSVVLSANTGTGLTYQWANEVGTLASATNATYTATAAGSYTVKVSNTNTCSATSTPTTIIVNALPTATIMAPNTSFCSGGSGVLSANTGTGLIYQWANAAGTLANATNATYTATAAGSYTVTVTNANKCAVTSPSKQVSITAATVWYQDTDGDGKGDASATLSACIQPTGYVSADGDLCVTDPDKTMPGMCGCNETESSCITTTTVIETTANIIIAPQPFERTTTIKLENSGMIQSITIINSSGVLVASENEINNTEITLGESFAAGIYAAIIQTDKGIYTTKIAKK